MSDYDKLTDEQLDEAQRALNALRDFYHLQGSNLYESINAELRALRNLRDEVEPVLRLVADRDPHSHWLLAADILARHYDKKEPTK